MAKVRDTRIDFIRGEAILMVILGHTISNNGIVGFESSGLYRIIFALQMPLFILISGFVTVYSKPINSVKSFLQFFCRRSLSYLFPWCVWTTFHGLLLDEWTFDNLGSKVLYLIYHLDSGYWFLFSLWSICIIWGVGFFIANKFSNKKVMRVFLGTGVSMLIALVLLIIGMKFGMSFLGIKLTLYYLPFFFIGYFVASSIDYFRGKKYFSKLSNFLVFFSFLIFVLLTLKFNIVKSGESFSEIIIRFICSLSGCIVFTFFSLSFYDDICFGSRVNSIKTAITLAGKESLGLYLSHYFFLNLIHLSAGTLFNSVECFCVCFLNYIITLLLASLLLYVVNQNIQLKFLLFGKVK